MRTIVVHPDKRVYNHLLSELIVTHSVSYHPEATAELVRGKRVVGELPPDLIPEAAEYITIDRWKFPWQETE